MKRYPLFTALAMTAMLFLFHQGVLAQGSTAPPAGEAAAKSDGPATKPEIQSLIAPTLEVDKTSLDNGGTISVKGTAPAGKPVYIEVWSDDEVRTSYFDSKFDKDAGKIPYILYMTEEMPAYYRIYVPTSQKDALAALRKEGDGWSYSKALKDLGADIAYSAPAKAKVDSYQATLTGSIIGSRGTPLPALNEKDNRNRSMRLVKARFRTPDKVLAPAVQVNPDGSYSLTVTIDPGSAPGQYHLVAVADKQAKSEPVTVENHIRFPMMYFSNAGTSVNILGPFFLSLFISIFGVLMGAGGGFMLNPLLVSLWPFPHTIVAGTVMPTVLFSQGSGIYNYSRIKFISWKLGVGIGLSMVLGGFIGPKLTEMITLSQYKFVFGWILLVLAGLMFWQTTPAYLAKNKKEQAILKEYKKKAEAAASGGLPTPKGLGEKA